MNIEREQERFKERLNTILYTILASPLFIYGLFCMLTKKAINFGKVSGTGVVYDASAVGIGLVYIGVAGLLFFGAALKHQETRPFFMFRAFGVFAAAVCLLMGILYFGFL